MNNISIVIILIGEMKDIILIKIECMYFPYTKGNSTKRLPFSIDKLHRNVRVDFSVIIILSIENIGEIIIIKKA